MTTDTNRLTGVLKLSTRFREDRDWFLSQRDPKIDERFLGRWIAIYNKRVIAIYDDDKHEWRKLEPDLPIDPEDCFHYFVDGGKRSLPGAKVKSGPGIH